MKNKYLLAFALALLIIGTTVGIRSLTQSSKPAPATSRTNIMAEYADAQRKALISGTAATDLTDAEVRGLMNDSIKTNLAAQLWFRQAMLGNASAQGAKMAQEIRVLETLRAERTEEAIRLLEDDLDSSIIV